MNYRVLFWVLVAIAFLVLLLGAIEHKIAHPQPVYERYMGCSETPPIVAVDEAGAVTGKG